MQLNLFPTPEQPKPKQKNRQLLLGDRVTALTWGGQKGTIVKLSPLTVLFDGRDYEVRLSNRNAQGVVLIES